MRKAQLASALLAADALVAIGVLLGAPAKWELAARGGLALARALLVLGSLCLAYVAGVGVALAMGKEWAQRAHVGAAVMLFVGQAVWLPEALQTSVGVALSMAFGVAVAWLSFTPVKAAALR